MEKKVVILESRGAATQQRSFSFVKTLNVEFWIDQPYGRSCEQLHRKKTQGWYEQKKVGTVRVVLNHTLAMVKKMWVGTGIIPPIKVTPSINQNKSMKSLNLINSQIVLEISLSVKKWYLHKVWMDSKIDTKFAWIRIFAQSLDGFEYIFAHTYIYMYACIIYSSISPYMYKHSIFFILSCHEILPHKYVKNKNYYKNN